MTPRPGTIERGRRRLALPEVSMPGTRSFAWLSFLLVTSLPAAQDARAPQVLALTHVTVIDVRDGELHRDETVVIRGNRITAVGPTRSTAGPRFITAGVLVDGPHSKWQDGVAVADSPERGRAIVDSLADAGADFIKVYSHLCPEVYRAIVQRAGTHGIPVAGHVPHLVSATDASEGGAAQLQAPDWDRAGLLQR